MEIVKNNSEKENKLFNTFMAFISGGVISLVGEIIFFILTNHFNISHNTGYTIVTIIFIVVACVLTGLSVFDNIAHKFKAGVLIPITGFAHSMSSSAMDNNDEGFVFGMGSNMFKLGGTVILYGVVSSFIFAFIKGVFL